MKRAYLEEDVALIRKYFPGAKAVTARTPFDFSHRPVRLPRLAADTFRPAGHPHERWGKDALWTN